MLVHADNLVDYLREADSSLSRAERKVAAVVLQETERVLPLTLAELAARSEVSEPTVIRFCRALGCDGYQDFKVKLAQSLVTYTAYTELEVKADDSAETYSKKIIDSTIDVLSQVRHRLDTAAIDEATKLLSGANKIEFYGVGASGSVAIDAHHKFFRLMVPCVAYADSHMQYMSAATLGKEDVVVAISHTGRTKELLESVALARQSGASIVAITAPGSPLAGLSTVTLAVDVPEDTDIFTPMFSRLTHLVIIDILAVGTAMRGGEQTAQQLRRMKETLRAKRLPRESALGAERDD